jgi:hypothetical protein
MTTLTHATNQWSSRSADERFSSLESLHEKASFFRNTAVEAASVPLNSLRVQAAQDDILVTGRANVQSSVTNWAFGQLASLVKAPASYLRSLPATLAAQNLNHGLAKAEQDRSTKVLFQQNGGYQARAFTGEGYARIWNSDITSRLIKLTQDNPEWQPAPAAFDGSRGLYLSDHDIFAFLVDSDRRIFEKDPNGGLGRGFFVANSEVGDKAFWIMTFFYEYVCGNHRVWGASGVKELRIRHVGDANARAFGELEVELKRYAESSAKEDELKIESARKFKLGASKDEVLDRVFSIGLAGLSRKLISEAYDTAETRVDWYGDPRSAWGIGGGLTQIARDLPHADERTKLDRAAGKILQIAF